MASRRLTTLRLLQWDLKLDAKNVVRYGRHAPFRFQRIWIDPNEVQRRTQEFRTYRWSARVVDGDWDLGAEPLEEHPVFIACRLHWGDGVPWAETGVYEWLLRRIETEGAPIDGCSNIDAVAVRYRALDAVFEQVRAEGALRPRSELAGRWGRERGGIRISVGRDTEPIFNWAGHHRLAMARILNLPQVPAQLHVVHPGALPTWRKRFARSR
jgi:hypothetical protein